MSDIDAVKAEISEVQRLTARREYEHETARNAREEALKNLRELGAKDEEAAETLLEHLRDELADELRAIQKELEVGE